MNQPDIIGRIPKQAATYDEDDNQLTATTWREGFHVNTVEPVPAWESYRCDPQPDTPYRVYAGGVQPVCYRFPDRETYEALQPQPDEDTTL